VTFTGNKVVTGANAQQMVNFAQFSGGTTSGFTWDNNQYFGLNNFYSGTYDGISEFNGTNLPFAQWQSGMGFDAHSSFSSSLPTGKWIVVRPNKYEAKRANITIYNWGASSTVAVDLSSVLKLGDQFVIRDAQNFYGNPIVSATYSGGTISIPMTGLTKASPNGFSTPAHTAPQFGVFVVMLAGPPLPLSAPPMSVRVVIQ
jgi:hypothetical protein